MKHLAILAIILFAASCTKSDDPKPAGAPTIIGQWTNDDASDRNPTFTADSVFWQDGITAEKYALNSDTIVVVYPDGSIFPRLTYTVSSDNQHLTLVDYWQPNRAPY